MRHGKLVCKLILLRPDGLDVMGNSGLERRPPIPNRDLAAPEIRGGRRQKGSERKPFRPDYL
jgi:hypothetical protein